MSIVLTPHSKLLTTLYSLLTAYAYHSLLTPHHMHDLLPTPYRLPVPASCLPLTPQSSHLTPHRLPLTADCLLLTTHCLLLTAHCSLLSMPEKSLLTAYHTYEGAKPPRGYAHAYPSQLTTIIGRWPHLSAPMPPNGEPTALPIK